MLENIRICNALPEKITYVRKHNFTVERKIAGNLKKSRISGFDEYGF